MNNFSIVSNCFLCEEHSLHVMNEGEVYETMQCINCGYASANKFKGFQDDTTEAYRELPDEMKKWSKYANGRVWIPSVMTLPMGMLFPQEIDNNVTHQKEMKWAYAEMIKVEESERENYPIEGQEGKYYEQRYDTDNIMFFPSFLEGMAHINQKMKDSEKSSEPVGLKLPKLNKK